MSMSESHQAFARDVVALARKHRIQHMHLGFSTDGPQTRMVWHATHTAITLEIQKPDPIHRMPWRFWPAKTKSRG